MLIKKGQKINVKKISEIDPSYHRISDGSIFHNGKLFNLQMQKYTQITAKENCSSKEIPAEEGWYWSDWMLQLETPLLMNTE